MVAANTAEVAIAADLRCREPRIAVLLVRWGLDLIAILRS